jgi:hypothetical protein
MTFLWQHCVFVNTSYLSQYIILLTTSFKASQANISTSVCSSAGITPANTKIHHFAGVNTGKRQNVVFHINKDSISDSVYTIFCSCYHSVGEVNQYYQPYLDNSNNGPSDIIKSQRLFFYYQMYMIQEQPEGLPECERTIPYTILEQSSYNEWSLKHS